MFNDQKHIHVCSSNMFSIYIIIIRTFRSQVATKKSLIILQFRFNKHIILEKMQLFSFLVKYDNTFIYNTKTNK